MLYAVLNRCMKRLRFGKYYFACPACGNDKKFFRTREESTGNTGCLIFLLGGFLPFIAFARSRSNRIQCAQCGYVFKRPDLPCSPVATLSLWIVLLIVIAAIIGVLAELAPSLFTNIPGFRYASAFRRFVEGHSRGVALYLISGIALLFSLAAITSAISNFRYHRKLRSLYSPRPLKFGPTEIPKGSLRTEENSSNSTEKIT